METDIKIGVITVTYNSSEVIDDFMSSLLCQEYENFLLYIVDNNSSDNTLETITENYPDSRIKIIKNDKNLGVAQGNNQGIKTALNDECELILLINNDVKFDLDLVSKLIYELDVEPSDILVPKIMFYDEPEKIWFGGGTFFGITYFPKHIGWGEIDLKEHRSNAKIEYAPTCCMLIRKSVFERIGLMDEKYFVYVDDVDFCLRAKMNSVRMYYTSNTMLFHKVSSLTGLESDFSLYYGTRNRVYFVKKHVSFPIWIAWLLQKQIRIFSMMFKSKYSLKQYYICQKGFIQGIVL
jgi:GT2 family glycosyltransferase